MFYREIQLDDMQAIFDVRIATWHNDRGNEELASMGITPESVQEMMKGSHRGWLCEVGSQVVGFAMGNKKTGEMWVIAVLPQYEGIGVGKRLLTFVEDWLFSEGWKEIWLTTDTDESIRAVGFYRHQGWRDWKFERGDRFMKKIFEHSTADDEVAP